MPAAHPGLDLRLVPGVAAAAAPRVVDDVGPVVGVAAGGQQPVGAGVQVKVWAAAVGAAGAGDPLAAGRHAHCVLQGGIIAGGLGAHSVGAVVHAGPRVARAAVHAGAIRGARVQPAGWVRGVGGALVVAL